MDDARALLDSLMGNHRNLDKDEVKKKKGKNFLEDNVCKLFLVGFCPQHEELFHSTKRDIGKCSKLHSEALKEEFEAAPDKEKYLDQYLEKLRRYLEELVRNADDWVARERRNIAACNTMIEESGPNEVSRAHIQKLQNYAKALIDEADNIAEDGWIEDAKHKMTEADELKKKSEEWESKAKELRTEDVCEVCGSRMESGNVQKARFKHFEGKIHVGYEKIRKWLADVRRRTKDRQDGSEKIGEAGASEAVEVKEKVRERSRSRSRSRRGARTTDRDRDRDRRTSDRDRDRDRGTGARDRERDGDRGRDRDRDRRRH